MIISILYIILLTPAVQNKALRMNIIGSKQERMKIWSVQWKKSLSWFWRGISIH